MKKLIIIMVLLSAIILSGCDNGESISGRDMVDCIEGSKTLILSSFKVSATTTNWYVKCSRIDIQQIGKSKDTYIIKLNVLPTNP